MKKENIVLLATIASAVLNVSLNLVLIPLWGEVAAALTTLLSELLAMVICACAARRDVQMTGISNILAKSLAGCFGIGAYAYLVNLWKLSLLMHVVVCVAGSVFVYFVIEVVLKNSVVYSILEGIKNRFAVRR